MEAIVDKLRVLVPRFFEVECAYCRAHDLYDGQTFGESTRPPATSAQLDALEASLGRALPPSYRAFLSLWNGASFAFGAGADLLGTEDHAKPHVRSAIENKRALFTELESRDPFSEGAIPFLAGDSRVLILFEPPVRDDGEMDVVSYYLTRAEHRDPDLVAFFERQIALHRAQSEPKPTKAKAPSKAKKSAAKKAPRKPR